MPAMPPRAIQALLLGALACTPFVVQSQAAPGQFTLYRCGPQGHELRNTPCPQESGASQVLHFDPDDAEAAAAARERVRREGLLAERLAQGREARARAEREALERAATGVVIGPKAVATSAATSTSSASAPSPARAPREARTRRSSSPAHKPPRPGQVARPPKSH